MPQILALLCQKCPNPAPLYHRNPTPGSSDRRHHHPPNFGGITNPNSSPSPAPVAAQDPPRPCPYLGAGSAGARCPALAGGSPGPGAAGLTGAAAAAAASAGAAAGRPAACSPTAAETKGRTKSQIQALFPVWRGGRGVLRGAGSEG